MAYTTPQIRLLIAREAHRQGIDPRLALAVATQESSLDPGKVGDNGKSLGLFQLQRAAAIDAGIDPTRRGEIGLNVQGGVAYLKQKLQQSGGNVEQALSRYNRGTPTYRGIGDPRYIENVLSHYRRQTPERPGFLRQMARAVTPASAEAAPPMPVPRGEQESARSEAPMASQIELRDRLREIQRRKATSQPPATAPTAAAAPDPGPPVVTPRSPALAQEQAAAAQQPWWQRAATAVGAASPEIVTYAPDLPQIEQAKAEMSPAERAELQRMEGTSQGGGLSDVGEIVGQVGGSLLLPGLGTAIGGTIGSVAGMTADTALREGRLPTWKEVATEAAWSAVPEVAESTLRGAARRIGRGTEGGRRLRFDEAARRARQMPGVFEAQTRQQVGQQFDAVRASGLQLDITPMRQEIQVLGQGKYEDLLGEVQRLDRLHKTGGRYQQIVDNLRNPGGVGQIQAVSVGDLQDLRSRLRVRSEELTSHEARQLVENFQGAVDDAIDAGIARGSVPTGMTVANLQEARREWSRVRAHEDLSVLVERVADTTEDMSMSSFRVKQLANALRRNEGPLARRINHSLDHIPGARAEFTRQMDDLSTLYQTVELPMAEVFGLWRYPGFAMIRSGISQVLLSRQGREVFREAIIEGRGRLSLNGFAAAVNAARRESGQAPLVLPGREEQERSGASVPTTPPGGG